MIDGMNDGATPKYGPNGPHAELYEDLKVDFNEEGDANKSVAYSEDALALEFTRRYGSDWRYVALWHCWLQWEGRRWRCEDTLKEFDLARQICRDVAEACDDKRTRIKLCSASTISAVVTL